MVNYMKNKVYGVQSTCWSPKRSKQYSLLGVIFGICLAYYCGTLTSRSGLMSTSPWQSEQMRYARHELQVIPARVPTVTVFIHGIKTDERQGMCYRAHHYFVEGPWHNIIMPDKITKQQRTSWIPHHWYGYMNQLRKGSLGQDDEIDHVARELEFVLEQYPDHAIVLYGVSRGAALAINTTAYLQKHRPAMVGRINALVLEAPFAHVNDILERSTILSLNLPLSIKQQLFNWCYFPKHRIEGAQPITSIAHVPDSIPLFFAGTIHDEMVPLESTKRLVNAAHVARDQDDAAPLELCVVKVGDHARMFCEQYRQHLISFYRKIGLTY